MNNKIATASVAVESARNMVEWNEEWAERISRIASYPCIAVIQASFVLGLTDRIVWPGIPGMVMILYGVIYSCFIGDHVSLVWRDWLAHNRKNTKFSNKLWRIHADIHMLFVKKQKLFLLGAYVLSAAAYVGVLAVCEFTYHDDMASGEVNPAFIICWMLSWTGIGIISSLLISYIATHQNQLRDDIRESFKREH